jgi:enoyl-CoA hydratase/carnithine racemase
MSYETIQFEMRGPIGLLTFNRPDRLNAISQRMIDEVNELLDRIETDENVRALVVTGAGRAFSAGFDLKDGADRPWGTVGSVTPILKKDFDFIMRFWHFALPTVAAVKGYALAGACELAMACDITIAAAGTRFGEPELRFGSGIVALLMPWLSGPKKAKEAILTGNDKITAEEALAMGLVNRVVPEGEELATALAIAREIAINDRQKVALTKKAINRTYDFMGLREALDMGLETDVMIESLETPEGKMFKEISRRDGLKAALAWRDARFEQQG